MGETEKLVAVVAGTVVVMLALYYGGDLWDRLRGAGGERSQRAANPPSAVRDLRVLLAVAAIAGLLGGLLGARLMRGGTNAEAMERANEALDRANDALDQVQRLR